MCCTYNKTFGAPALLEPICRCNPFNLATSQSSSSSWSPSLIGFPPSQIPSPSILFLYLLPWCFGFYLLALSLTFKFKLSSQINQIKQRGDKLYEFWPKPSIPIQRKMKVFTHVALWSNMKVYTHVAKCSLQIILSPQYGDTPFHTAARYLFFSL